MKPIRIFTLLVLCAWVQATVFAQTDTSDGTAPKNGNRQATIQDIFESILAWEEVGEGGRFEGFFGLPGSPDTTIPEIEALAIEQVVPSIVETWDDDARQRNINLSCLYNFLGSAYREWGGDDRNEKERYYKEKSLEAALDSESDLHIAYAYNICGDLELRRGNVPRAHELLYESVHFWERAGQLAWASSALYTIASNFMEMRDVEGLGRFFGRTFWLPRARLTIFPCLNPQEKVSLLNACSKGTPPKRERSTTRSSTRLWCTPAPISTSWRIISRNFRRIGFTAMRTIFTPRYSMSIIRP